MRLKCELLGIAKFLSEYSTTTLGIVYDSSLSCTMSLLLGELNHFVLKIVVSITMLILSKHEAWSKHQVVNSAERRQRVMTLFTPNSDV